MSSSRSGIAANPGLQVIQIWRLWHGYLHNSPNSIDSQSTVYLATKVKLKMFLYTPRNYLEGVEAKLHSFTSSLVGGVWPAACPVRFTSEEMSH